MAVLTGMTITGGMTFAAPAESISGSVLLNGSQFAEYADASGLNVGSGDFTVEFFGKFNGQNQGFFSLGLGADRYSFQSTLKIQGPSGDVQNILGVSLPQNVWTHVAFARQGSSFQAFIGGSSVANFSDSTNYTMVGAKYVGLRNYTLTGYLSNFRVVKGTALYTSNFIPPAATLTAVAGTTLLLTMSTSGTVWTDSSSNGYVPTSATGTWSSDNPFS